MNYEQFLNYYGWFYSEDCQCGGMYGRIFKNKKFPSLEIRVFPDNDKFRVILVEKGPLAEDRAISDLKRTVEANELY